jgi:NitT/TauT family transport system substrate-binding protein
MKLTLPIIGILCLFLLGCIRSNESEKVEGDPGKIIIGENQWPGYIALTIADHLKLFEAEGLDVEILTLDSLEALNHEYLDGKYQGRTNLLVDAIQQSSQGIDHRVIFAIDYSNGSDAIVSKPDIESPKDLIGKKIAFEKGTITEYFLHHVLNRYGYRIEEINHVQASAKDSIELLRQNQVDAAVTYEPFLSEILDEGNHHNLFSSGEAPGLITDVMTFRKDFLDKYPKATLKFCKAYFNALDILKQEPERAHSILAQQWNLKPEDIQAQLEGIQLLDLRLNKTAFTVGSATNSIYSNARLMHELVSKSQNWEKTFNHAEIIERTFLRRLETQIPNPL